MVKMVLLWVLLLLAVMPGFAQWKWFDPLQAEMNVVQGQGWDEALRGSYARLPQQAKDEVRPPVWSLSRNSAGVSVCFYSNAPQIRVRYQVTGGRAMPHMPATGVSGVDLYARGENGEGMWCAGNYSFGDTIVYRYQNLTYRVRHGKGYEYCLYLPLYNSVKWLEIGVPEKSDFAFVPRRTEKPIVVYGTSIAQGACASRPGMAWTSIVGRRFDRPVVNLGFSGNGKLEKEMLAYVNQVDAAVYVLDCMPNMYAGDHPENLLVAAVEQIRSQHPHTPILITEHDGYTNEFTNREKQKAYQDANQAARRAYERLMQAGVQHLYYLSHEQIGMNMEAMVDGVHSTDWGMVLYADAYEKVLRRILREPEGQYKTTRPVRQRREAGGYEWNARHEQVLQMNREVAPERVILGNSIVHYWGGMPAAARNSGGKVWDKRLKPAGFRNLGFGWDRIENVLWRVYHDELSGYEAKEVVLMIGTNNLGDCTDEEIAEGIRFLAEAIRIRQPSAVLKVVGILPRGGMEERIRDLNQKIQALLPAGVVFTDAGKSLLNAQGKIEVSFFRDGLHPNEKGYERIVKKIVK